MNQKLSTYKQWIRELEMALAHESQLHPLLNTELLKMTDDTPQEQEEDVSEAFGSLELGEDGKSRWMGPQDISSWILQVRLLLLELRTFSTSSHVPCRCKLQSNFSGSLPNNDISHLTYRYTGIPEPDSWISPRSSLRRLLAYIPAKGILDTIIQSYYTFATSV